MSNKKRYQQICEANDVPLFAQYWWLNSICENWDVAVTMNGNNVGATWAYPVEPRLGLSVSRLPILTPYLGPNVYFPADLKKSKRDNFEHETIHSLLKQLPQFKVMETALVPGLKQAGVLKSNGFVVSARQTFLVDLQTADEASMLADMHEDTRRNITKAEKEITIADNPLAIDDLYRFQKAILDRKETTITYGLDDLNNLHNACRERKCTALWTAQKDGITQAVLWNIWDKTRSYYLVGAKNPEIKDTRAVTALIWHAMKHCKALGKQTFDFEGSMIPGVERFFRTFGTRRELYLVITKNRSLRWKLAKALQKVIANPRIRRSN